METTICDITSFDYWRIPPVVQLLIFGDENDPSIQKLFSKDDMLAVRQAIAEAPLCKSLLQPSTVTRNLGGDVRELIPLIPALATNHAGPIDVLVDERSKCHASKTIRRRFSGEDLPPGSLVPIGEYMQATSPAFTLLQIASRTSLTKTAMLASELCGSFAIYKAPEPVRAVLQNLARNRLIPKIGGWEPLLDGKGSLTDLWSRPALTTLSDLENMALGASFRKGSKQLLLAASLIAPKAASPFEARAGILFGFPRRFGGEGFSGLVFNKRVDLTRSAQGVARRSHCYCDLYWNDGLDIECQSAVVHDNAPSFLSDSERTAALKSMGIDVLPITYGQLQNERSFETLSKTAAKIRGLRYRPKTNRQAIATQTLRADLFTDWRTAHLV